jgi:hypothetical protein
MSGIFLLEDAIYHPQKCSRKGDINDSLHTHTQFAMVFVKKYIQHVSDMDLLW